MNWAKPKQQEPVYMGHLYPMKALCVWCDTVEEINADTTNSLADKMIEHIKGHLRICPSHPMRQLEREIRTLEALLSCSDQGHTL